MCTDGFVVKDGRLYALIHRDVAGISPRWRTRGRLEWRELRRPFVERLTRAAHSTLPGCAAGANGGSGGGLQSPLRWEPSLRWEPPSRSQPSEAERIGEQRREAEAREAEAKAAQAREREVAVAMRAFDEAMAAGRGNGNGGGDALGDSEPIRWWYNRSFEFRRGASCALVGSGATLGGRGLGKEIDAHDYVIRVNRLPQRAAHYFDVGRRTSVWFSKPCRLKPYLQGSRAALTLQVMDSKHSTGDADGPSARCPLDGPASRCPFGAFVGRGGESEKCFGLAVRTLNSRQSAALPIGIVGQQLFSQALKLHRGSEASTGLHAFLAFAPRCAGGLRLYGFSGNRTNDGHHIGHAVDTEHALLAELARRTSATKVEIVP